MDKSLCECPIYRLGQDTKCHKQPNLSEFINETSIEQKNSVDIDEPFCSQCHQKVGKGIRNPRGKGDIIQNLHLIQPKGSKISQRAVSSLLKKLAEKKGSTTLNLAVSFTLNLFK